ncbi:hypothetical protein NIES4072_62570 [Nostoc commune NIES-4072]|uniref:Uncharacterized protein n=1 Tax=Nostoc commune NIES-4072 TaxID=2005467 RepID=A0A2R5FUV5_NOSCO|nr:hypothetical protein NIES4070_28390 [Nostoc commune HK-02]GBG22546.1 hypothetical protein NIES4072_62570 [Nostoc commune NIES-4072]
MAMSVIYVTHLINAKCINKNYLLFLSLDLNKLNVLNLSRLKLFDINNNYYQLLIV